VQKDLFEELNPEQKRAVETTEGPLLILAGAGSGKTKTLTHRIAYILATKKATPFNILAVTFTNKAANEMRQRTAKLTGHNPENRNFIPFLGTFHGICVRILRQSGEAAGIPRNFVIWDEADRTAALRQVGRELHLDEKKLPPRFLASLISGAKNEMVSPAQFAATAGDTPVAKAAVKAYPLYEKLLASSNALDFDDLIGKTVNMLSNFKEIRQKWQDQFTYIVIDEYQDTNAAQYQLVKLLTGKHKNIAVVGDDWQSIYSWRGADFRNILNFEKDYSNCTVIKLEQNYRSTKNILDAAHAVISQNLQRSDKKLWTAAGGGAPVQVLAVANERAEAETIARRIRSAVDSNGRKYNDFAILYRINAQSRAVEEVFLRYNLPYRIVGGVRFYDRAEIKDIVAYLRLIYQPEDQPSFARVVNIPPRGIGKRSLEIFEDWRDKYEYSLSLALTHSNECDGLTPKAKAGFSQIADLIVSFRAEAGEMSAAVLLEKLLKRLKYLEFINDGTPQGEARAENVRELLSVASQFEDVGLDDFLEEVALISDMERRNNTADAVTLMTLHSAKGLEFPVVYVAGLEESILPHSRSLYDPQEMEEERRLLYVGMTRAREELYLSYATERALFGGRTSNPPSRFLADIEGRTAHEGDSASIQTIVDDEPHYVLELAEGDVVDHQLFGKGTVLEIAGDTAVVYFKGKGAKRLNIAFAPLTKLN